MAAPTFQAAGTLATGTTSLSVPWPAHTTNDIALMLVATEAEAVTTPSGWNTTGLPAAQSNGTADNAAAARLTMFWRRAQSGAEGNVTVTIASGLVAVGRIFTYRGCKGAGSNQTVSPIDVSAGSNSAASTTVTFPAVTTTGPDRAMAFCLAWSNDSTAGQLGTVSGGTGLGTFVEQGDSGSATSGGAGVALVSNTKAAAGTTGTPTATIASTAQGRMTIALIGSIEVSGAVTTAAPAVSGAVAQPGAQFVSSDNGGVPRDVTIAAGTTLLVVATINNDVFAGTRVVSYDGVPMALATPHNDWVQINYMIDPPVGTASLTIDDTTNASTAVAAHYSGISAFQAGQQQSAGSASYSPSGAGVIVMAMSASSVAHTPVASTVERLDGGGNWYGDRIVTGAGSVTVGTSDSTDPDSAGAIFLFEVAGNDVTGAVTTSAPAVAGALSTPKNVTGAVSTSSAAVAGALSVPKNVSGAVITSAPAVAGALSTPKNVSGAVSTSTAAAAGSLSTPHNITGAVTTSTAAVSGAVDLGLVGSVTTSAPAVSGALSTPKNVTGAVSTSGAAVAGALATPHSISGAVSTSTAAVAGSLQAAVNVTGAVSTSVVAVSGALSVPKNVSGAVTTSAPAVSGSLATPHALTGAVSTSSAVVAGALATPHAISGAVSTSTPEVAGSLTTPHNISGAVTTSAPGLTGSISVVDEVDLNGAVSTSSAAVSGALATPHAVSGAVSTSTAAVAGSLATPKNVSGAVSTSTPEVAGSLQPLNLLSGALTTSTPAVAGSMTVVTGLTGAVSTSGATVSGALNVVSAVDLTGAVSTSSAAVSGALATPHAISGAVSTSTPEVAGSLTPAWDIAGAVSTSGAAVSGAFITPLGLDGDLQTGGAFVTGSLLLPLNISGSLATTPVVADALLFPIPPQGIPGAATLEVAAAASPIHIRRALALSSVAAAEATIESKDNGSATI